MRSSDILAGALVALVLGLPSLAQATPNFPPTIARELQLEADPQCSLCHAGGETRRGTVTTPFGATMRSRGLQAYAEPSLVTALQAITAEKKDSDGDGSPDVEELKAGSDPNLAAGKELPDPPEYGCSSSGAHRPAGNAAFAAVCALAMLGCFVRRRART